MAKKEPYKDWIVRYYGSHNDIPPGHTDGELTELIRCRDCKYYPYREIYADDKMYLEMYEWCTSFYGDGYCSMAERKEHETD